MLYIQSYLQTAAQVNNESLCTASTLKAYTFDNVQRTHSCSAQAATQSYKNCLRSHHNTHEQAAHCTCSLRDVMISGYCCWWATETTPWVDICQVSWQPNMLSRRDMVVTAKELPWYEHLPYQNLSLQTQGFKHNDTITEALTLTQINGTSFNKTSLTKRRIPFFIIFFNIPLPYPLFFLFCFFFLTQFCVTTSSSVFNLLVSGADTAIAGDVMVLTGLSKGRFICEDASVILGCAASVTVTGLGAGWADSGCCWGTMRAGMLDAGMCPCVEETCNYKRTWHLHKWSLALCRKNASGCGLLLTAKLTPISMAIYTYKDILGLVLSLQQIQLCGWSSV